ncbi:MAG: ATP-binding protein [Candidatus Woesearchaeota archaeon]
MAKSKDLVLEWDKRLGWNRNPFKEGIIDPISESFTGYYKERKKLNLFIIKQHGFGVIKGESGTGKTMMLKWVQNELQKYPDKISVRFLTMSKVMTDQQFTDLLVERTESVLDKAVGFYAKLRKAPINVTPKTLDLYVKDKLRKKRLVLLIDDAMNLAKSNAELLAGLYERHEGLHIVMAGTPQGMEKAHFKDFKDFLKLTLEGMEVTDAQLMIQKRLENAGGNRILPFTTKEIAQLTKKANGNPSKLLQLCQEEAIRISLDEERVKHMREILAKEKAEREAKTEQPTENTQESSIPAKQKKGVLFKIAGITITSEDEEPTSKKIQKKQEETIEVPEDIEVSREATEQLAQMVEQATETVHQDEIMINDSPAEIFIENVAEEDHKPKKKQKVRDIKETDELISQLAKEFSK